MRIPNIKLISGTSQGALFAEYNKERAVLRMWFKKNLNDIANAINIQLQAFTKDALHGYLWTQY